ncbi:MAG: histidinol-phosphate transaminase [Granulosicoccus sp.]
MNQFWTETVRRLSPYVPGEQRHGDDIVKLNTNENPWPPSAKVLAAITAVDGDALRRYPDPESTGLCTVLAKHHRLESEQVFVGNGSDEILALAFLAYFTDGQGLQYPAISYSFYPVYCDLYGIEKRPVEMGDQFLLELEKFKVNQGGIVFPNPNAPTSRAVSRANIESLLRRHTQQVVLVDEAYADFGAESVIPMINDYPNLLVCHTFSKGRSLAGLRLGVAYGDAGLIEGLRRVKNSFNSYPVDALAQQAGIASIQDNDYYQQTVAKIIATREWLVTELEQRQFSVLPSAANFIFVSPSGSALELFNRLNKAAILVRYWPDSPIDQWLRISIGTEADMQRLLKVVDDEPG